MPRSKESYKPRKKNRAILARAWELVNTVEYQVSGRWVFYQLLQEGFYKSKDDYSKWCDVSSKARHAEYEQWKPDTLADETREPIYRGRGFDDGKEWLQALSEQLACRLDMWRNQENYVELWFEARAMTQQFKHYTKHITLRPMGGQPSVPYKYQAAQEISHASLSHKKPVKVLYFGDYDEGGLTIQGTILEDVTYWCESEFEFIHCGLTLEQAKKYNVPENFEKPNNYQWEALSDSAAREIIEASLSKFVDYNAFDETETKEQHVSEWVKTKLIDLIDDYEDVA